MRRYHAGEIASTPVVDMKIKNIASSTPAVGKCLEKTLGQVFILKV
jgi:hypothetical protein